MVIFSKFVKNGEMLKMLVKTLKQIFAVIFLYSMDIKIQYLTQRFTNIFCHLY